MPNLARFDREWHPIASEYFRVWVWWLSIHRWYLGTWREAQGKWVQEPRRCYRSGPPWIRCFRLHLGRFAIHASVGRYHDDYLR